MFQKKLSEGVNRMLQFKLSETKKRLRSVRELKDYEFANKKVRFHRCGECIYCSKSTCSTQPCLEGFKKDYIGLLMPVSDSNTFVTKFDTIAELYLIGKAYYFLDDIAYKCSSPIFMPKHPFCTYGYSHIFKDEDREKYGYLYSKDRISGVTKININNHQINNHEFYYTAIECQDLLNNLYFRRIFAINYKTKEAIEVIVEKVRRRGKYKAYKYLYNSKIEFIFLEKSKSLHDVIFNFLL